MTFCYLSSFSLLIQSKTKTHMIDHTFSLESPLKCPQAFLNMYLIFYSIKLMVKINNYKTVIDSALELWFLV